jgi:hypothetical protein
MASVFAEIPGISPEKTKGPIEDQNDAQDNFCSSIQSNLIGLGKHNIDTNCRINKRHEKVKIPQEFRA